MQRTTDLLSFWCCFVEHGTSQYMSERSVFVVLLHVFFGFYLLEVKIFRSNVIIVWVFPKIVVPQNGWFIMEIPTKRMIWGYPYFRKRPYLCLVRGWYSLGNKKTIGRLGPKSQPTARWAATSYIWGWGSPISCIVTIKITGISW